MKKNFEINFAPPTPEGRELIPYKKFSLERIIYKIKDCDKSAVKECKIFLIIIIHAVALVASIATLHYINTHSYSGDNEFLKFCSNNKVSCKVSYIHDNLGGEVIYQAHVRYEHLESHDAERIKNFITYTNAINRAYD